MKYVIQKFKYKEMFKSDCYALSYKDNKLVNIKLKNEDQCILIFENYYQAKDFIKRYKNNKINEFMSYGCGLPINTLFELDEPKPNLKDTKLVESDEYIQLDEMVYLVFPDCD